MVLLLKISKQNYKYIIPIQNISYTDNNFKLFFINLNNLII